MFCIHCGHELDSNNVCHNNSCPSNINKNSQHQNNYNNNSTFNQNFNGANGYYNYSKRYNCDPDFVDNNGITLLEMTQFMGNNSTSFYIDLWTTNKNNPNFISWNWPAFFSSWVWLFYRKLNILGAIYFSINLLSLIFLPIYVYSVILFASSISCALLGNQLYIKQCIKRIRATKALPVNMDANTFFHRLRSSGGISTAALIIGIIIAIPTGIFASVKYASYNIDSFDSYKSPYYSDPFSKYNNSDSDSDSDSDNSLFDYWSEPDDSFSDDSFDDGSGLNDSLPDDYHSTDPGKSKSKSSDKNL